jgi:hypothetical protein
MSKNNIFPDALAPFEDKVQDEYGLKVAQAIAQEWFEGGMIQEDCDYNRRREWIQKMRLYSRGSQSIQYYQNLMSRNDKDLNYLNLDWRPDNTVGKYVNLVANGMNEKYYRFGVTAIDRISSDQKGEYRKHLEKEMYARNITKKTKELFGLDLTGGEVIPESDEELDIHLSTKFKPKQEIAEELLVQAVFDMNEWDHIKEAVNKDLVQSGIGIVQCYVHPTKGIVLKYVNAENYIHSYIENDNNFKDKYYEGEVRTITISELRVESNLSDDELRKVIQKYASRNGNKSYTHNNFTRNFDVDKYLDYKVDVLDFSYKTSKRVAYKKKYSNKGTAKLIRKESTFNAPRTPKFETIAKTFDVWFEGSFIIGSDIVYGWKQSENIAKDTLNRAQSRYITFATDIYKNQLHSFESDIIPIADRIHITKLKLQHIIAEIKPGGAEIDFDMLANLTGGDKVDYKEILSIFNAKGIVFKKRIVDELGNVKEGRAVEELHNGIPANLVHLLQVLQHQNQELREVTGINPSADGTQPSDMLVGVQQAQLMAKNTITQHIVEASKKIKLKTAEIISTRISDIFEFPEFKDIKKVYQTTVGKLNVDILEDIGSIHLHEFGFSLELLPTPEEMAKFDEYMKIALQKGLIDEDDVYESREIAKINPKYAIQYLKVRKKKRTEELMQQEAQRSKIKSQNDIASANAASGNRIKEKQAEAQIDVQKERALAEIRAIEQDFLNRVNAPLRDKELKIDLLKEQMKSAATLNLAKYKEEAKDKRQDKNNTDHSKMIKQRQLNSEPIDFSENEDLEKLLQEYL